MPASKLIVGPHPVGEQKLPSGQQWGVPDVQQYASDPHPPQASPAPASCGTQKPPTPQTSPASQQSKPQQVVELRSQQVIPQQVSDPKQVSPPQLAPPASARASLPPSRPASLPASRPASPASRPASPASVPASRTPASIAQLRVSQVPSMHRLHEPLGPQSVPFGTGGAEQVPDAVHISALHGLRSRSQRGPAAHAPAAHASPTVQPSPSSQRPERGACTGPAAPQLSVVHVLPSSIGRQAEVDG
jgi:hypothetical protein